MAQTTESVAVLGTRTMGRGMASSALRAGIPTIVWDRRPEVTPQSRGTRSTGFSAPSRRRRGTVSAVVTMVPDADAVISIARDQGMLAALVPGAIWAQMSTIGTDGTASPPWWLENDRT